MGKVGWIEEPELNYAALVIHDEESGDTLEFQRPLDFDEQDAALAMTTYCIVRAGAAHYGGLESYHVGDSFVGFRLTRGAAELLDLPQSFEIPIDLQGAATLREHLPDLLR